MARMIWRTVCLAVTAVAAGCASDAESGDSADDATATSVPGPACTGSALSDQKLAQLMASGELRDLSAMVQSGETIRALKLATMTYGGWRRSCTVNGGRKTCDAWQTASSASAPWIGAYLGGSGDKFNAGLYGEQPYDITQGFNRDRGTNYAAAMAKSISRSKLLGFQTAPMRSVSTSTFAGGGTDTTGGSFTGTIRATCSKFWFIKQESTSTIGGVTRYSEYAQVYHGTY